MASCLWRAWCGRSSRLLILIGGQFACLVGRALSLAQRLRAAKDKARLWDNLFDRLKFHADRHETLKRDGEKWAAAKGRRREVSQRAVGAQWLLLHEKCRPIEARLCAAAIWCWTQFGAADCPPSLGRTEHAHWSSWLRPFLNAHFLADNCAPPNWCFAFTGLLQTLLHTVLHTVSAHTTDCVRPFTDSP